MRKLLLIVTFCFLSICLVGCGCSNNKDFSNDNNKVTASTQIEKTISNLYTDNEKLVYDNNGIYKIVFYYDNENITGLEHYYEYENEKKAKEKYEIEKENLKNNSSIKMVSLSGKYVVYTLSNEQYEGKTIDEVKEDYSFLIPIYKD